MKLGEGKISSLSIKWWSSLSFQGIIEIEDAVYIYLPYLLYVDVLENCVFIRYCIDLFFPMCYA